MPDQPEDERPAETTERTRTESVSLHRELPERIGAYRIGRKLGEGGMGVVYEAQQSEPHRPVALKVIRGGRHLDDSMVRLFSREAQALARLSHPGIASIFEFGRTDDGRPFFAMELVRGDTLSGFLRDRASPAESRAELEFRLRLFRKICDAINYAHQRAVIHRDLKPSNLYVLRGRSRAHSDAAQDDVPDVKVLDFGMARITDGDVAAVTALTEVGRIQGTLAYMSPEQARGNPDEIDLRSDVYSLGVVLYEMLLGRLPCDVSGVSLPEALRLICEQAPQPLVWRSGHAKRVDRDLETIVRKTMEKNPARRYQSVGALATDVDRYLAQQPILARPPSTTYQLRLLMRRHKVWFAFGATVVALLLVLAVTMTVQTRRVANERDTARRAMDRAESLNSFLVNLFEFADPDTAKGSDISAREILDSGADQIDRETRFDPRLRASMMTTMGALYRRIGDYEEALELLEGAAETQDSSGIGGPDLAKTQMELAQLYYRRGNQESAHKLVVSALEILRRERGAQHPEVAGAQILLGSILFDRGEMAEAESSWRSVIEISDRQDRTGRLNRARALHNLALLAQEHGDLQKAETLLRQALEQMQTVLGADDTEIALTLSNLAEVIRLQERCDEAESLYRRALEIRRALLGEEHESVGVIWNNLAECAKERGALENASRLYSDALNVFEKQLGPNHDHVAIVQFNLGDVELRRGNSRAAEQHFLRSLEIARHNAATDDVYFAETLAYLASALAEQGKHPAAERRFREALHILEDERWFRHGIRADTLERYAGWLDRNGRAAEAGEQRAMAAEIRAES